MRKYSLTTCFGVALVACALTTSSHAGFAGQVINFDFNFESEGRGGSSLGGFGLFAGDNAVLSSPGGTTWNDVQAFSGASVANVPDQFGVSTPVALGVIQTQAYSGATPNNELQDSGLANPRPAVSRGAELGGGPVLIGPDQIAFAVRGLLQTELYNLALYLAGDPKSGGTDVDVHHAGGTASMSQGDFPGFLLPGQVNGDFLLFNGLNPVDQGGGEFGFLVTVSGGIAQPARVGGLQVQGVVPEPATLGLLLVGAVSLWRFRPRS